MKTVFDKATREELIKRINGLNDGIEPQWGKMNVYQMIKHCTLFEEIMLGKKTHKRMFIGRLFGKMALKSNLKADHLKKNMPTLPWVKIKETENGDVPSVRSKWIALIAEYGQFSAKEIIHPFFGKMTKGQIGQFAYKHTDHHLRQFNIWR